MNTITEKAEMAIDKLNGAALEMHRQMKSGELDKPKADKLIISAQARAQAASRAYFARKASAGHLFQLNEFRRSGLQDELTKTNDRFNRVLKHYAARVGAKIELITAQ